MAMDLAKIEDRLDKTAAGAVAISSEVGGIQFQTMLEVMEFAKLMALSQAAVPSHLRGNPGACLAISIQALEWKMSPFAVANKSYLVNNKGEERIAYESQLLHAIIEARAPLQGRLRFEILGEGDDRRCKVYGTFKGETEPHVYISETLGKLRDARGRNDYGKLKGSPLWDTQPEVQLFYSASRQWGRLYCPDTILGIYTPEELDNQGPDHAKDINQRPDVASRLKGNKGRGFSAHHVEQETHGVIEDSVTEAQREAAVRLLPPASTGDEPLASDQELLSNSSGAVQDRCAAAAPILSDSSQHSSPPIKAETDKPAAGLSPLPNSAAGDNSESLEGNSTAGDNARTVVGLPVGWQGIYAQAMTRVSDKPKSLATRRTEALRIIGGEPSNADRAEMEAMEDLVKRRNSGALSPDAFKASLREIMPTGVEI